MKFFCISDNIDTQMGMRLAGIEGVVVHEYDETMDAIHQACQNQEIGIVLSKTLFPNGFGVKNAYKIPFNCRDSRPSWNCGCDR